MSRQAISDPNIYLCLKFNLGMFLHVYYPLEQTQSNIIKHLLRKRLHRDFEKLKNYRYGSTSTALGSVKLWICVIHL